MIAILLFSVGITNMKYVFSEPTKLIPVPASAPQWYANSSQFHLQPPDFVDFHVSGNSAGYIALQLSAVP
jgi:hypothetical protein